MTDVRGIKHITGQKVPLQKWPDFYQNHDSKWKSRNFVEIWKKWKDLGDFERTQ